MFEDGLNCLCNPISMPCLFSLIASGQFVRSDARVKAYFGIFIPSGMFPRLGQSDLCRGEPLNVTGDAVVNLILLLCNDEGLQCTQRAGFAEIGTFLLELFFFF